MRNSAMARLVVMGALTVGLLIPLMWVYGIVCRAVGATQRRRRGGERDVGRARRSFGGPVLAVPYTYTGRDGSASNSPCTTPSFCRAICRSKVTLATETRRRGIFDVMVYRTTLKHGHVRAPRPRRGPPRPGAHRLGAGVV